MAKLTTTSKVIDRLGGNKEVAALTGSTDKAVSNWRRSKFPAASYVPLKGLLIDMGLHAPDTLWTMRTKPRRKK